MQSVLCPQRIVFVYFLIFIYLTMLVLSCSTWDLSLYIGLIAYGFLVL